MYNLTMRVHVQQKHVLAIDYSAPHQNRDVKNVPACQLLVSVEACKA